MKVLVIVGIVMAPFVLTAQKRVLSLPFEFEKRLLATSDYDAYSLDNKADSVFSLILKDNRKAEYVLLDKNLKILSKIDLELPSTVFTNGIEYCGGTTNGKVFNFIYKKSSGFELETVDYNTKTVTHRSLHKIPSKEMELSTFSDNNTFYTITADNNADHFPLS